MSYILSEDVKAQLARYEIRVDGELPHWSRGKFVQIVWSPFGKIESIAEDFLAMVRLHDSKFPRPSIWSELLTMIAYYKVTGVTVVLKLAFDWRGEEL